ncbi:hypothetical protein PR202_ga15766 [Eleusine coracana subsp. coracana]|uniref:Uncharacterized protein n=1 Tax=Eleusine coracana subsp. coracana TaxID=191504 RepID=A0AAV5CKC4_ELECO|nr:hypothetical protein PR202_ga15766 [Eleusine coracana subsp. coracana]
MTFVLVGHDDERSDFPLGSAAGQEDPRSEATDGSNSDIDVTLPSVVGHFRPASAVSVAAALRWVSYAAALSAARALLAASQEDLRLGAQRLSRTLSGAFFLDAEAPAPFAAGGARFPEGGLYVCVDLPPFSLPTRKTNGPVVCAISCYL